MKKIRCFVNLALSAVIVALGFGSCVSQQKYQEAQEEIQQLKAENDALKEDNAGLKREMQKIMDYKKRIEERKVVYGPRPTSFQEKINR
jgi:outer membrane murein-binding lipoprotein Lpp